MVFHAINKLFKKLKFNKFLSLIEEKTFENHLIYESLDALSDKLTLNMILKIEKIIGLPNDYNEENIFNKLVNTREIFVTKLLKEKIKKSCKLLRKNKDESYELSKAIRILSRRKDSSAKKYTANLMLKIPWGKEHEEVTASLFDAISSKPTREALTLIARALKNIVAHQN